MKNNPEIKILPVDSLIPYANNARTHSDSQVLQVAASIKEFGFTNPVLVDKDNGIIAGHGRVLAAKKLGMTEVPCIVLDHLTDAQRKAYIIADNKLALNSGWDVDILGLEIQSLNEIDFDVNLLGFGHDELLSLTGESKEVEPDVEGMGGATEFGIFIELQNENDQKTLFEELESRGFTCKIMN